MKTALACVGRVVFLFHHPQQVHFRSSLPINLEVPNTRKENSTNIYVGNLPAEVGSQELRQAFEAHGEVTSAKLIMDRYTGRSRGFGFVEVPNKGEAQAAMNALDGTEMGGRTLRVEEARPRRDRPEGYRDSGRGGRRRRW